jgi:hypothetical protein
MALRDGELIINGNDLAVREDEVGSGGLLTVDHGRGAGQCVDETEQQRTRM